MERTGRGAAIAAFLGLLCVGCGGGEGADAGDLGGGDLGVDTGTGGDAGHPCTSDLECDDGLYCNGVAHCAPMDSMADARGCLAMTGSPCVTGQTCDEASRMCLSACETSGDADADGHDATACGGDDCDDADPDRYPGNAETCDTTGHDEDCDVGTFGPDRDSDGFVGDGCCNRNEAGTLVCGTDCDDTTMDVSPTAPEVCDGIDDDCDGTIDEGVLATFFHDLDGDGFGVDTMTRTGCSAPSGYVLTGGDCDDTRVGVHPGATDVCNMIDDDCDSDADPGCACSTGTMETCGAGDGMGGFTMVGACHPGSRTCTGGAWGPCVGSVVPGLETCNGADDDCDGTTDEGVTDTYFRDSDGDGYGNPGVTMPACSAPLGYVIDNHDCDDTRPSVHAGAMETCNAMDDDCNGLVDELVTISFYRDVDGDGHGNPTVSVPACIAPAGYVAAGDDCNDGNAAIHPGAADPCDGIDNNCDGTADVGCGCIDGTMQPCGTSDGMGGFLTRGICHPGMQTCGGGMWGACAGNVSPVTETCNGLDDDCDGTTDDGVLISYYRDCDADGYGATGSPPMSGCSPPGTPATCGAGTGPWAPNGTDCNDALSAVRPGVTDTCDGVDNDCDTVVDGAAGTAWCNTGAVHTAAGVCSGGTCSYTCAGFYLDCDPSHAMAGCEVDGGSSMTQCGSCTHGCRNASCTAAVCVNDYAEVQAGDGFTCGRRFDGTVLCWGLNAMGQLGDGSTASRPTPVPVMGASGVSQLAVSEWGTRSCAILSGGTVWCWGNGPAAVVSGLSGVVQLVSGAGDSWCARSATGALTCWGSNMYGQLGDGTTTDRPTPPATPVLTDALDVAIGSSYVCAVRADRSLSCWGRNAYGELGDGTTTSRTVPTTVPGISGASEIGCGDETTCVRTSGTVRCWGHNDFGQVGDGTTTDRHSPVAVTGVSTATQLSVGDQHACVITSGGSIDCWGRSSRGELGVESVTGAARVSCGRGTSCVRLPTDELRCSGFNLNGQLGDGTTTNRTTPATVTGS